MNKKFISIIGAVALTLSLVVGGIVLNDIKTAASGTQMDVSVESPTVEKDEEIKVKVTASSGEAMSYIKGKIIYDSTILEFVNASSEQVSGVNGELYLYETLAYGENAREYELTFKALEVGTTDIVVTEGSIELYESLELINVEEDNVSVEVIKSTTASDDARIEDLMVAGILNMDKIFNPDVYEYDLEVGVDMEMFIYSATPMNKESIIVAPEDLFLEVGANDFEVQVTAPAGNVQTYVFHVTRLDHTLEDETETAEETILETEVETEESVLETETVEETTAETVEETAVETEAVLAPISMDENADS